ncbi:MAG: chlorophyll synthesis pathway protein BchC [Nitratireductor sp.]|nr:chlorophyll synthesis pathway protein BchC [Nitratireductor sp.]
MKTNAVVLEDPRKLSLQEVSLVAPGPDDLIVETAYTAISAGTERLLWEGRMPQFPGMGYPLVPGYESVGRVVGAGENARNRIGQTVFVPGARCFEGVRALFGGAAGVLVTSAARVPQIPDSLASDGTLLALAATAHRAVTRNASHLPGLVVGHGVLGRLIARIIMARGGAAPVVWERSPARRDGAEGYAVIDPDGGAANWLADFESIIDASGDPEIIDKAVARLAPRGEIILAGFYKESLSFRFAPAFMKEASIRISAEFDAADMEGVLALLASGALSLGGLITHSMPVSDAAQAYEQAFDDPSCLKMVLDWRKPA